MQNWFSQRDIFKDQEYRADQTQTELLEHKCQGVNSQNEEGASSHSGDFHTKTRKCINHRTTNAIMLNMQHVLPVLALRFLFILLGPFGRAPQYHEIGRSIATLMTDEVTRRAPCPYLHLRLRLCFFSFSSPERQPGTLHKFTDSPSEPRRFLT